MQSRKVRTGKVNEVPDFEMSALGHKRTFRSAIVMSALPPKADMCGALVHVRLVPCVDGCVCRKRHPTDFGQRNSLLLRQNRLM
jgi:hypothetical protein